MKTVPLRLTPDVDLRRTLEKEIAANGCAAAFVLSGVGSLRVAILRLAGARKPVAREGDLELLTLAGTVSAEGSHLHASVSNAAGQVFGGHVAYGCIVRTTAEVLVALLPEWRFDRQTDPATGFRELVVRAKT